MHSMVRTFVTGVSEAISHVAMGNAKEDFFLTSSMEQK